jgi:hypothetical protein
MEEHYFTSFVYLGVNVNQYYELHTIEYQNGYSDYPDSTLYYQVKHLISYTFEYEYVWYCDGFEKAQLDAAAKSNYTDVQQLIDTIKNIPNMVNQSSIPPIMNPSDVKARISRN